MTLVRAPDLYRIFPLGTVGAEFCNAVRQTGRRKKTRWDCVKNDMESLGLSQKGCTVQE